MGLISSMQRFIFIWLILFAVSLYAEENDSVGRTPPDPLRGESGERALSVKREAGSVGREVLSATAEALAWDKSFKNRNDPSGRAVKDVQQNALKECRKGSILCRKHFFNVILKNFMGDCYQIATNISTFALFLKHKSRQRRESVDRIWFQICFGDWFQSQA